MSKRDVTVGPIPLSPDTASQQYLRALRRVIDLIDAWMNARDLPGFPADALWGQIRDEFATMEAMWTLVGWGDPPASERAGVFIPLVTGITWANRVHAEIRGRDADRADLLRPADLEALRFAWRIATAEDIRGIPASAADVLKAIGSKSRNPKRAGILPDLQRQGRLFYLPLDPPVGRKKHLVYMNNARDRAALEAVLRGQVSRAGSGEG